MTARLALLWCVVVILLAIMLGVPGVRARAAADAADAARTRLQRVSLRAEEMAALRASLPALPVHGGQDAGLTPRVTETLAAAGLPPSVLTTLSPEAEVGTGEGSRRRRRATLTLAGVTLPQVGGFLDAWRQREPAWMMVGIDLAPQAGPPPAEGGDLPLRAVLVLESMYAVPGGADR